MGAAAVAAAVASCVCLKRKKLQLTINKVKSKEVKFDEPDKGYDVEGLIRDFAIEAIRERIVKRKS